MNKLDGIFREKINGILTVNWNTWCHRSWKISKKIPYCRLKCSKLHHYQSMNVVIGYLCSIVTRLVLSDSRILETSSCVHYTMEYSSCCGYRHDHVDGNGGKRHKPKYLGNVILWPICKHWWWLSVQFHTMLLTPTKG